MGISTFTLCLFPHAISAEDNKIYRWVDPADKSIHYSQTVPAGVTYESVEVKTAPSTGTDTQKRLQEMEKSVDEGVKSREADAEKKKQQAAEAANRKQQCQQLRDRLTMLENSPGKLLYKDKSGQMTRMTEERRQQNITEFKNQMETVCSPRR